MIVVVEMPMKSSRVANILGEADENGRLPRQDRRARRIAPPSPIRAPSPSRADLWPRKRVAVLISGRGFTFGGAGRSHARSPDYPAELLSSYSYCADAAGLALSATPGVYGRRL